MATLVAARPSPMAESFAGKMDLTEENKTAPVTTEHTLHHTTESAESAISGSLDARYSEGAEMYRNRGTVDKYGYVARRLKSRHVQFIALGGSIGTGLFVGIGSALTSAGPAALLIGYTLTGLMVYAMMQALGEMTTWLPLPGAIPQFCDRYVDDALAFAVGWNNWYADAMTLCTEISAAAVVIQYWPGADHINVAAWITIIIVLVVGLNIFAVQIFGEAEFIFASIKIITILGLLLLALIIDLGGGPSHDRLGFRYWKHPYKAIAPHPGIANASLARFLSVFSTLINASFSYGGIEMVAVAAGEAKNPRRNVPRAVRRVFWRIVTFYVLGSLAIGLTVPYNDPKLLSAQAAGSPGAASSPWVIAIKNAGISGLPSVVNVVIITSASSSANSFLYIGSRYLYSLSQIGQAPRLFLACSASGVPWRCVLVTASVSLLTYLSAGSGGPVTVFLWFQNLTTVAGLFTWCSICLTYIRFHAALKAQGIDRNTLMFKSPFQPYLAWTALVFFSVVIIFQGFNVFLRGNWSTSRFLAAYLGVPIFFCLYAFWKILKRSPFRKATDIDLFTGKTVIDQMEAVYEEPVPRNLLEKVWNWVV